MGIVTSSRRPYLVVVVVAFVTAVAVSTRSSPTSPANPDLVSAQAVGGPCEDVNNCLIWGVEPVVLGTKVFAIDVCARTTTVFGPFLGDTSKYIKTAAANTTQALILGDIAGGTASYALPAGPPGPNVAATIVAGAKAFTEAFSAIGLGQFYAGVGLNTHTPVALLGAGTGNYSTPEGDLVFDHAPSAKWPLKAAVILNPTTFQLVDVSRADGSHHAPRPVANFLEGLAYDGSGNLWGLSGGSAIYAVNPATGVMTLPHVPASCCALDGPCVNALPGCGSAAG